MKKSHLILVFISFVHNIIACDNLTEGWCRYHVTSLANLTSITKTGLDPKYGSDITKSEMSYLYDKNPKKNARYSDEFKYESKNYIYVGKTWDAVEQYITHMIVYGVKCIKYTSKQINKNTV